eukprot:SM000073S21449  [mRNA]  locus=s73:384536:389136:- [translate_table: standard]
MVAAPAAQPRYAAADPTLPAPWKALVDDVSGYHYYWNPETNVTQYEKPAPVAPVVNGHSNGAYASVNGGPKLAPIPTRGAQDHSLYKSSADAHQQATPDLYAKRARPQGAGAPSAAEVEAYRRAAEITVIGDAPAPFMTFESAGFSSEVLREGGHCTTSSFLEFLTAWLPSSVQLLSAGFPTPTPIQAQAWPVAMEGRDVVAVAKTGSGKTLGYLCPGFIHIQQQRVDSRMGPTVLVLAPTRELATQIQDEAVKFGRSSRLSSTVRLRILQLKSSNCANKTLMFTATWPKEVRRLAQEFLISPVQVNIGNTDELAANKAITQIVEMVTSYEKQRRLEQILRSQEPGAKVIIFCSTKRMCDQLARSIGREFGAAAIHGDKSQQERDYVLGQFKQGRAPILVATDVAARGLDIKDIRAVINYDFPTGVEDYVHRIGRTGRAGATGLAYTFFGQQDGKYARELIKVLEGANQNVPPELRVMATQGGFGRVMNRWGGGGGGGGSFGGGGGFGGGYGGGGRGDGVTGANNIAIGGGRGGAGAMAFGAGARYGGGDVVANGADRSGAASRLYKPEKARDRSPAGYDERGGRGGGRGERGRGHSRSPSRSPPRKRAHSRSRSLSRTPPWRRSRSRSRTPPRRRSHSRSPPRRR